MVIELFLTAAIGKPMHGYFVATNAGIQTTARTKLKCVGNILKLYLKEASLLSIL